MGSTLSEPITQKETKIYENETLKVVSCAMQGWRRSMEDTMVINFEIPKSKFSKVSKCFREKAAMLIIPIIKS